MTQLKPNQKEMNIMTIKTILKTVLMLCVICAATLMGGCLTDADTAKGTVTAEDLTRLESILTNPKYSDAEKQAAFIEMSEKCGVEIDIDPIGIDEAPEPDVSEYHVQYTLGESGADLLAGIGYFTATFNGILVADNTTVSGFKNIGIDKLESVEIFVNNESVAKYTPVLGERNKIETTQVGDWIIRIEGTLTDGTTLTIREDSQFNGMRDMSDHPDYTGPSCLGERYIETSDDQMTREEAKALCDELGIVWGDDRDIPTTKPTLTSTKVTPTVMPTATPTPDPTLPDYYVRMMLMIVDRTQWDENTIALVRAEIPYEGVKYVNIYVDGDIVATIKPIDTSTNRMTRYEFDAPMIINLPEGISNTGEITMSISVYDLSLGVDDGEYPIGVDVRTPPMRLEEEYNTYPVWNP